MNPRDGYQFGPFQIDVSERACRRGDESIPIPGKAFDLLLFLVRDPGRTLTKAELMAALWPETAVEEKNLTQTVFLLRKALGDEAENSRYIQTLPRLGYRFVAPVITVDAPRAIPPARSSRRWKWLAAAAFLLGTLAAGWRVTRFWRPRPLEQLAYRLQLDVPEGGRLVIGPGPSGGVALSPDGKTAAYVVERGGKTELWIRPLDRTDARPLAGADGAEMPFWSPDNKSLAFFSGTKLLRVELAGGPPVPICEIPSKANGGAWSRNGRIIVGVSGGRTGLLEVPASGGKVTPLTNRDSSRGEVYHYWPQVLPGGRFLYSVRAAQPENSGVFVASFADPTKRTKLLATDAIAFFASGGDGRDYLLWSHGSAVVTQQLDLSGLKLVTEPQLVADPVARGSVSMGPLYAAASGGVLLYAPAEPPRRLMWLDRAGKPLGVAGEPGNYFNFRISPEGSRVALARINDTPSIDLWVLEVARGVSNRLTSTPRSSHLPVWSPDGRRILFCSGSPFNLYLREANGSGTQMRLTNMDTSHCAMDWSPDGRFILYYETGQGTTQQDLWVLPMSPDGKPGDPKPFLHTRFAELFGRFSPQSAPGWVAYQSDESGRFEVYVQSFPEPREARRISTVGGQYPQWNPNGRELFYVSPDNKLMAVSLTIEGNSVEPSPPHELFSLPSGMRGTYQIPYDTAPDGRRFLVQGPEDHHTPALTVIVNWPALLK